MSDGAMGRLEPVELREAWAREAEQFTPWLAEAKNLALLGQTLGLDLELEAHEKEVGPFRADILCRDSASGQWVLIENQLERTDHTHLGQLLTYAAGLEAVTIIWVARQFAEEHRAEQFRHRTTRRRDKPRRHLGRAAQLLAATAQEHADGANQRQAEAGGFGNDACRTGVHEG